MHIVVIEDCGQDRQWLVKELKKAFSNLVITEFGNASDFLLTLDTLSTVDVIITSNFLPLLNAGPDVEKLFERLQLLFLEVVTNWTYQEAAERLMRYMRKNGINIPVIIYTHSCKEEISQDIFQFTGVTYCNKNEYAENILSDIREILSISA